MQIARHTRFCNIWDLVISEMTITRRSGSATERKTKTKETATNPSLDQGWSAFEEKKASRGDNVVVVVVVVVLVVVVAVVADVVVFCIFSLCCLLCFILFYFLLCLIVFCVFCIFFYHCAVFFVSFFVVSYLFIFFLMFCVYFCVLHKHKDKI